MTRPRHPGLGPRRLLALLGTLSLLGGCARVDPEVPSLAIPPTPRVVVVAPHPDDETLATGGLLQRVHRAGGQITVVVLTDGDGYLEAAAAFRNTANPEPADFRALGIRRSQELDEAIVALGLPRDAVVRLHAPDDGLATLWRSPDRPYVSPHTGHGPFLGRTLTRQLAEVIRRRQPTLVVYPDPRDTHADHAAAGQFTAAALATAGSMATALTYFVHDAEWPPPLDPSRPMPVPPDVALRETRWVSLSLSATELEAKRRALDAHRSQWPVLGGLLERFLRPNEIFATGPPPG